MSQRFTDIAMYPGHCDSIACPHTMCFAQSPLPGEHSSQALLDAQKLFDQQLTVASYRVPV